jgi:large subunit ribosomal protein L6
MSRLGKKPIQIPVKVEVEFKDRILEVTGPKGKLLQTINKKVNVRINDGNIFVEVLGSSREHNMLHGLIRGLIVNMVKGVTEGFRKELEAIGLGYKINIENDKKLMMMVGFSHIVNLDIPSTVKIIVTLTPDKNFLITVMGIDKYEVGAFSAKIRAIKPPDHYKGFGIRYLGEKIIKKAGKAAAGSNKK